MKFKNPYGSINVLKNEDFTCNEVQNNVPSFFSSSSKRIPSWSVVFPIQIRDCYVDSALDNSHPGLESHKRVAEKIGKFMPKKKKIKK